MLLTTRRVSAAVLTLAFVMAMLVVGRAEIIEQVLVKVNGEIITKSDLENRQIAALRQTGKGDLPDAELKKAIAELTPQLLVDTIDEMLMLQRGKELGYKLSDDQFNEILNNIKKENKLEDEATFQAALKQEGLTVQQLRGNIERTMIINRVQQAEVMGRVSVTEDESRRYYEAHANEFTTPSALTLREILVAIPGDGKTLNVAKDEETKAKAESLRARALAGEDFAKMASELSDSASKANGGLIGPINRSDLDDKIGKIFDALKVGGITEVLRTTAGYQFFKLESRSEAKVLPFDQAREQIADKVAQQKRRGEFVKYLQKLRGQALIEWKNAELKKIYDQKVAAEAAATPTNGN